MRRRARFRRGEIVPVRGHAFYDYDAKYVDPFGARLVAAAALDEGTRESIMRTAEAAYAAVRCEGMARVDFFIERTSGAIYLNEINTLPDFTSISMFLRMCEANGLSFSRLFDTLFDLALTRSAVQRGLRTER